MDTRRTTVTTRDPSFDSLAEYTADRIADAPSSQLASLRASRIAWLESVDDETTARDAMRAHEAVKKLDREIAMLEAAEGKAAE